MFLLGPTIAHYILVKVKEQDAKFLKLFFGGNSATCGPMGDCRHIRPRSRRLQCSIHAVQRTEMKVAHGHLMSAAACVHVGTGRDENIMPPLQSCRPCFALPVDEDRYSFLVEAVCLEVCT